MRRRWSWLAVFAVATWIGCGDEASNGDDTGVRDGDVSTGEVDDLVDRPEFEECVSVSETAQNTRGPADVILAIDNTPSMYNEIEMVRANMNRLSAMVESEGLDLHVALVSCRTMECVGHDNWYTICIDPPLGADGACAAGTDDSQPPDYLHVEERIESLKALESLTTAYPQWSAILRPGAAKHIIVVSDDNDETPAATFRDNLVALDASLAGFQFHSIFSYLGKEDACAVVASARLNCEWEIPPPPDGEELDPDLVNVDFFDGAETHAIGHVASADRCSLVGQGWYYDDPTSPTRVLVCPQTCEWIQGRSGAQIIIRFGCETEEAILI